ncbi:chitotriosidase-1-like [Aplysia californica]|uniref:Chitotriosidase-1-like n=1 Tax=Aplysia californica TaxID=6500 RepID=A0ABM1A8A1_APLCA|nr:chitotriosidase-1-like [Aplysia californica]
MLGRCSFLSLAVLATISLVVPISHGKKIFCYYSSFAQTRQGLGNFLPEDIDPHLCTHIIYAFVDITADGRDLRPFNRNDQGAKAEDTGRDKLLLTIATASGTYYINQSYEPEKIINYLDFMLLMTYNYHGQWEKKTGHHSGLWSHPNDPQWGEKAQLYQSTLFKMSNDFVRFYRGRTFISKIPALNQPYSVENGVNQCNTITP